MTRTRRLSRLGAVVIVASLVVAAHQLVAPPAVAAEQTGVIAGTVSLGADGPAPAGSVVAHATYYDSSTGMTYGPYDATIGADGTYRIENLRHGRYWLQFDHVGVGSYVDQWWPGVPFKGFGSSFIEVGASTVVRDIVLPSASTISGRATTTRGEPVGAFTVQATLSNRTDPAHPQIVATIDGVDGAYEIGGLPAGDYTLSFSPLDPLISRWISQVNVGEGAHNDGVDIELYQRMTVRGTVTCIGCDPADLERTTVVLQEPIQTSSGEAWTSVDGARVTLAGDGSATGTFEVSPMAPGRQRLEIQTEGFPRATPRFTEFTVADGSLAVVDLELTFESFSRDITGEGWPDVVATTSTGTVYAYQGTGGGSFSGRSTLATGLAGRHVFHAGDFSGDGRTDLMSRDAGGRLYLHERTSTIALKPGRAIGSGWGGMTALFSPGDFDGDGASDVLARDASGSLWLYPGTGSGGFRPKVKIGSGWQGFTALFPVGDFDGRPGVDVMARDSAGRLWLYPGDGRGGWFPRKQVGSGWNAFTAIVGGADFNGDRSADVFARDGAGRLWLYAGNGSGGWGRPTAVGTGWSTLHLAP